MHAVRRQFAVYERQHVVANWHDRLIPAGSAWKGVIDERLRRADIVLLLASPDFFGSDYCQDVEMREALELHESGRTRVIPVVLRPCAWESSPFAGIQGLPTGGLPITKWPDRDEACLDVARGVMEVVQLIRSADIDKPSTPANDPLSTEQRLTSGQPSPAVDPGITNVVCESGRCRSADVEVSDHAEVTELASTAEGWLAQGHVNIEYEANGRCRTCGRIFTIARRSIPVQFPDLSCAECGQSARLQYRVLALEKTATGYRFEVLASCASCQGQRRMSQSLPSLTRTSSIDVSAAGMRVQVD